MANVGMFFGPHISSGNPGPMGRRKQPAPLHSKLLQPYLTSLVAGLQKKTTTSVHCCSPGWLPTSLLRLHAAWLSLTLSRTHEIPGLSRHASQSLLP